MGNGLSQGCIDAWTIHAESAETRTFRELKAGANAGTPEGRSQFGLDFVAQLKEINLHCE